MAGYFLHVVGQNQRRRRQLVLVVFRDHDAVAPGAHAIAIHVLHHNVDAVAAGAKRNRLPVERGVLHRLFQQLRGHIHLHRVFKRLRNSSGDSGHATEDVDRAPLNAVLGDKGNVLVLHLQRDGNQHRVAGDLHVIGAHLEGHQVDVDLVADDLFQVLELDLGRRLDLGHHLQLVELFAVLQTLHRAGVGGERIHTVGPARPGPSVRTWSAPPGVCSSASFSLGSVVR